MYEYAEDNIEIGIKIIEVSMNKYNLEELKKQTLINILSAKKSYLHSL